MTCCKDSIEKVIKVGQIIKGNLFNLVGVKFEFTDERIRTCWACEEQSRFLTFQPGFSFGGMESSSGRTAQNTARMATAINELPRKIAAELKMKGPVNYPETNLGGN